MEDDGEAAGQSLEGIESKHQHQHSDPSDWDYPYAVHRRPSEHPAKDT